MKKRKIKIISVISAFLLSVAIVLCFAFPVLYIFGFSQGSILKTLEKTNYYEGVRQNFLESAGDFLIPTGLPEEVLEGAFPREDVEEMVGEQIQGTESAQRIQYIETKNRTRLKENIDSYLQEIGLTEGEVSEEQVESIINALIGEFQNYAAFPFAAQLLRLRDVYTILMGLVFGSCFLIGSGMIFLIYKVNRWKHILLRYLSYSCGGALWMLILLPLAIRRIGAYERVHISPHYVYYFFVEHIQKSLDALIGCGIIALICMIIFSVLSEKKRKRLIRR